MRHSRKPSKAHIALILPSVMASGTERRLSFVYRHLESRYPGEYLFVVSGDLYSILNRGGFGLDRMPGVRVLRGRSILDRKRGAHAPVWVNLGRIATLFQYRRQLRRWIREEQISLLHPYLELVPFLALAPIREIPWIVPVVDHLPKYFDHRTMDCQLLLRAIRSAARVDCLYRWISERLLALGVAPERLNNPVWNCVNHEAFRPEEKDTLAVSFAARTIDWKNPLLMLDVVERVLRRRPGARFAVLGSGKEGSRLAGEVRRRGWQDRVRIEYLEDPSPVINHSLIHVSLDRYDNFPNQSLLEGMAAGCAVVATDVGETHRVVTDEVGLLAPLEAEPLADAILRLLDNPAHAKKLGRAARESVMAHHHVDRYIDYLRLVHDMSRAEPVVDGIRLGG